MSLFKKTTFLAIAACVVWSTAFVAIKIGLRYMPPLHLAGLRFMLSGLLILPFCGNYRQNFRVIWQHRGYVLKVSFFTTFLLYSLFHYGISLVPASVTALVIGSGPLFIALFAWYYKNEPMTRRKSFAIATGFTGIGIIAIGRFGGFLSTEVSWLGLGVLILANLSGSFGNIVISNNKVPVHPVFLNSIQLFTGGVGIFIVSLLIEPYNFEPLPVKFYAALLWLSLIAAIGFSLWFVVLNTPGIKVSEINIWKFIIPVLGAVLSWIILPDESPEWVVIAGMLLVGLSLVVMHLKATQKRKSKKLHSPFLNQYM
jgi:drug/metabolite transporter (DMT)-like permease